MPASIRPLSWLTPITISTNTLITRPRNASGTIAWSSVFEIVSDVMPAQPTPATHAAQVAEKAAEVQASDEQPPQ